jgi:proline iminopeptidase
VSNTTKTLILAFIAMFSLPVLIFVVLFISTSGDYKVPQTVNQDLSWPQVVLKQTSFHAETAGDPQAPPLLILHDGPGGDYKNLLALKALSKHYYLIFFDQRGSGLSARVSPNTLSIKGALEDVKTFADYYAPGRKISLLGHGWGGMLASAFAGAYPQRVQGLILAEPGFLTSEMAAQVYPLMSQPSIGFIAGTAVDWVRALHVNGPDAEARNDFLFARIRQHPAYHCGQKIPAGASERVWRAGFSAWKTLTRATFTPQGKLELDFTKGLDKFSQPTLLLASSCNSLTGKTFQARQLKLFKQASLEVIPRSGHELFLDNPQDSLTAIEGYLAKVTPKP